MNVTDNHFVSDFFLLHQESSCFEIAAELSFPDREFVSDNLPSWINNIIELMSNFLMVSPPNDFNLPGLDEDNRINVKFFPDKSMNRFRVMSSVHDVTVTAFRGNESGNHLLVGISRDWSFQEMFSEFPGSFREIMAAVSAGKSGRIDSCYGNIFIGRVEQIHSLFKGQSKIE